MPVNRLRKYIPLLFTAVLLTVLFLRPGSAVAESGTPVPRLFYGVSTGSASFTVETPAASPTLTPQPTPSPSPSPSPVPTPTPVPTLSPSPVPTPKRKLIALTFDDGPNGKITPQVLDILKAYDVCGTFFLIGSQIEGCADVVQRMHEEGHEIGCHTWHHGSMRTQSESTQRKGFEKWNKAIRKVLGDGFTVSLLRPPGGSTNARAKRMAEEFGCPIVLWSVDTMDWSNRSRSRILNICKKTVTEGGIILMHDRIPATVKALPELIGYLQECGYEFVTVSELLSRNGETPEPGKVYRSMPAG